MRHSRNWQEEEIYSYVRASRLGGVVLSVLATGRKGRGFKPAEAMDF
jgi:hypothetical protein